MSDLLAVVLGVVCGALAAIPFGRLILMLVASMGRGDEAGETQKVAGPTYEVLYYGQEQQEAPDRLALPAPMLKELEQDGA